MKKILSTLSMAAAMLCLTACSDNDDYAPGQEVADDCPVVYFSSSNESDVFITSEGEGNFTLTLKREKTEGQLTVPIEVTDSTGLFETPGSVTFNDGESEAQLTVAYPAYTSGMSLSLTIPAQFTDPYTMLDGSINFTASLVKLQKVCDVTYQTSSRFVNVQSEIYIYGEQNRFLWKDFLGSGKDMVFTVDISNTASSGAKFDPSDLSKLNGDFIPLSNYTFDDAGGWYFTNGTDSGDRVSWTPAGQSEAVTSFFFWNYSGGSYSFIDFDEGSAGYGYGYFASAYVNNSGYETTYYYLYF